jgi:hypothetical protein
MSAGNPVLLFYVMPAVNLLAVAALAALGVVAAIAHGRSPWWGFVLPLGVNAGISLTHNFTDCVSNLAVFGLLTAWFLGWSWQAITFWAAAAVFAREQNAAVALLIELAALWKGRRDVAIGVACVAGAWIAWVGLLWHFYGGPPYAPDGQNLTVPFAGVLFRLRHLGDNGHRFSMRLGIIHLLSIGYFLSLVGAAMWAAQWRQARTLTLLLAGGTTLALLGGQGIFVDFSSYLRVYAWIPLGLWTAGIANGRSWPMLLLTPGLAWSLVSALRFA